jgi:hypothetical protein
MKLLNATILSILLLFGLACLAYAGEDQKNFSGEISIGGTWNNADDHYGRAAEYESGIENNRTYVFGGKLSYIGKDLASGVYGDCTAGFLEYSVDGGTTFVQAAGGLQDIDFDVGTFRTYTFAYHGTISGLPTTPMCSGQDGPTATAMAPWLRIP